MLHEHERESHSTTLVDESFSYCTMYSKRLAWVYILRNDGDLWSVKKCLFLDFEILGFFIFLTIWTGIWRMYVTSVVFPGISYSEILVVDS